jgi:two-component system chemotaxis sensor kinase CheA
LPNHSELRQQVEELAVRLVLADTDSGSEVESWAHALEAIRGGALREGAVEAAEVARGVISTLRASGDPVSVLQEGLARLQSALAPCPPDLELRENVETGENQRVRDASWEPGQAVTGLERPSQPAKQTSLAQDPELLSDFVLESREHLASLEAELLVLERDPSNSEALHAIFRSFHTIKGLAGFLELWEVQKLAHEVETVLDQARNLKFKVTPETIDVVLESADYLKRWLVHLESVLHGHASREPESDPKLLARVAGIPSLSITPPEGGVGVLAAAVENSGNPPPAQPERHWESKGRSETMAVKVDTAKLDYLVDMAGEMVIAETLVRHDPELARIKTPRLQRNLGQLTRITSELQKTAMAMRLVPIGPLFRRMARLVRDLSRQFGKSVEMVTEGDEIELDRTIVEELADPLMHMVRNSMDHGFEPPEGRKAAGKPASGRLLLKAQHQAGQVVIELSDDGRGLDRERILAKAVEKGLVASGEELSDGQIYELIFRPGFSTAAEVTNVSGRGVGMDVVRKHIEKLRGRIEIRSAAGQGSTFLLKLPLTLAIIDGLVVGVGPERYIVPLFAIREIFRPKANTIWTVQERAEMALVRGSLVPVVRLYQKFGVVPRSEDPAEGVLILAEVESQRFCLLVDELIGKQEVVIKSLGELLAGAPGIAGGAILGDGRVGLILDLDRLSRDKNGDPGRPLDR